MSGSQLPLGEHQEREDGEGESRNENSTKRRRLMTPPQDARISENANAIRIATMTDVNSKSDIEQSSIA